MDLKVILREELLRNSDNHITIFHGTNKKHINSIINNGLKSNSGYDSPQWYMVSTDWESALYHATPEDEGSDLYVIEFSVPLENNRRWVGFPYLWPPYERSNKSNWFALKQPIGKEHIIKVHKVPYDKWTQQKNIGY